MTEQSSTNTDCWMANLGAAADDVLITQFPLPGSHDAVSYGTINEKSKTQGKSILEQLQAGFRYFDLRVRVDDSIFFGHHGSDEVRDNQYCPSTPKPVGVSSTVFEGIQKFSDAHPKEIIILHFYDASAVWGQSFNEQDKKDFITHVSSTFQLASPPTGNIPPTFGELKRNRAPIIALINDSDSGWNLEGSFDATFCRNHNIWLVSQWFEERFSDYKRLAGRSYEKLYELTAADQEEYMINRDLNKFWVSQTILGYDNASPSDGHSANYWGAQAMNSMWLPAFKNWFQGKQWNGKTTIAIPKPNILLVDYSGVFGEFTEEFSSLLSYYHGLAADFLGTNQQQIAVFQDEGGNTTSLSLFSSTDNGSTQLQPVWNSGSGSWRSMAMSGILVGNFSGSGKDQIAVFYDYGYNHTGLWVFSATSNGSFEPTKVWDSGFGNWGANAMTQIVVGDFSGSGKDEIAVYYDYDNSQTALWIFSSVNSFQPNKMWDSGFDKWSASAMAQIVVGDFSGGGKDEIAVFYDYGSNETGLWLFSIDKDSVQANKLWDSGFGKWGANGMAKTVVGSFSNLGKDEIAIFYDYGNSQSGLWIFSVTGNGAFESTKVWESKMGEWEANAMTKVMAGNFSGTDKDEIAIFYEYPCNQTGLWIFSIASNNSIITKKVWESKFGEWNARSMSLTSTGDFFNSGKPGIATLYNYDLSTTGLWLFSPDRTQAYQPQIIWRGAI